MVIRFGALALLALALQLAVIHAPLSVGDGPRRFVLVLSYVLLLGFILANARRPGLLVIGVGLLLNFLAIVTNGGLMPISPETLRRTGPPEQAVSFGEWVPDSKDVLLHSEDTNLPFLTDILVLNNPTGVNAFSIGDVIIGAGLVITVGELLLPRLKRAGGGQPTSGRPSAP